MTTINEARESVYQRFVDNYVTTVFTFDNESFSPPEGSWVRLVVRNTGGGQETLGRPTNRKYRRNASVFAQVFTLTDQGTSAGDAIAREIRALYESVSFDGLDFNDGTIREPGGDGRFYQHLVEVFFDYEEIK